MYVYNTVVCVCISCFVLMFLDVITIYLFNVYSNQVNVYKNYTQALSLSNLSIKGCFSVKE